MPLQGDHEAPHGKHETRSRTPNGARLACLASHDENSWFSEEARRVSTRQTVVKNRMLVVVGSFDRRHPAPNMEPIQRRHGGYDTPLGMTRGIGICDENGGRKADVHRRRSRPEIPAHCGFQPADLIRRSTSCERPSRFSSCWTYHSG